MPNSHWGTRGILGLFNPHLPSLSPFRALLAKGPLLWLLGSQGRAWGCCIPGERWELCWVPHPDTGFTFRSVLRIQTKVHTLALLGHFRTMNPPGPFSPLWEQSQEGQAEPGWNFGWDSPRIPDAEHGAEPGSEGQSPVGQEQMLGAREGVCALAPGAGASTAGQLSHRCLGSVGARAATGAAAPPLDCASCSPREALPGTALGVNKRSQEAQDRLSTCHSSPQILPGTI